MKSVVNFVLLREGTSDDGLIPHLRELIILAGADEAIGTSRPFSGTILTKLMLLANETTSVDIVFVHRDSDASGRHHRVKEIRAAEQLAGLESLVVPVVPVREMEAWLFVSEQAIREVVGRPTAKYPLQLPKLTSIEQTASPKEVLLAACLAASGHSGRRLERERKLFSRRRSLLLERLDPNGPVRNLPAWIALRRDVNQAVSEL